MTVGLPAMLKTIASEERGLVLVTGTTSLSPAAVIDQAVDRTRSTTA